MRFEQREEAVQHVARVLTEDLQVEDRLNADYDILEGGVQAIILVEDEVRFYSAYLPHFYTQVTTQTSRLMSEGVNLSHRLLRIRARPKILLAQTYEEAWELYERYSGNLLGIITDPNVAYILLMVGVYGLILEFYNPGMIFPSVVGVVCLLLGAYGLQMLPVNYAGLGLIFFILGFLWLGTLVPPVGPESLPPWPWLSALCPSSPIAWRRAAPLSCPTAIR